MAVSETRDQIPADDGHTTREGTPFDADGLAAQSGEHIPESRADTTGRRGTGPQMPQPAARSPGAGFLLSFGKRLATLGIAAVAIVVAIATWQEYVAAPWTRNGNVRVQVANVAPRVSGHIIDVEVNDNQFVHKGDTLYRIDPFDFETAVRLAKASVDQAAADLEQKRVASDRRQHLTDLATTPEEQQTYAAAAAESKSAFDAAQQQLAQAQVNLQRTTINSPVDGYVTNLLLRVGDFATAGMANVSVIDSDSFWIDGYFEETKMARICVGDVAEAKLMGYAVPIVGHVQTVTRGISVSNATPGTQGLPSVDPIYTWVRLAQRVPVRIAIETVPDGVPLVSGMTATVTIRQPGQVADPNWFQRIYHTIANNLVEFYAGVTPRPGCLSADTRQAAPSESLPVSVAPPPDKADEILPGIAPGMDAKPR